MIVIAHRGNINGPDKINENSLTSISSCLERGWGIETDIRRKNNEFYISHNESEITDYNIANKFCKLFLQYPESRIALNIKELGYETDLVEFLSKEQIIDQIFLFDMELLEKIPGQTAKKIHAINSDLLLAARVSDRGETINQALSITCAKVIWADEFDSLWITAKVIEELKDFGKTVYAVSPEIHGFPMDVVKNRWRQFIEWGIDGICTDYAEELDEFIKNNIF